MTERTKYRLTLKGLMQLATLAGLKIDVGFRATSTAFSGLEAVMIRWRFSDGRAGERAVSREEIEAARGIVPFDDYPFNIAQRRATIIVLRELLAGAVGENESDEE